MSEQSPKPNSNARKWWWISGGVVAVAAIVTLAVVGFAGGQPTDPATASASPTTSTSPTAITASPSASATTTAASSTASATPTRAVKKLAYCRVYAQIRSDTSVSAPDGESVDFAQLSKTFAKRIKSYRTAAAAAPSSLDADYAKVLGYLTEAKKAVDSQDLDAIKDVLANLPLLNESMATIQAESQEICG